MARAIEHAYRIISWQENLVTEEVPPKWMWAHEHELEEWFEEVKALREQKYGGGPDTGHDDDPGMMSNDLAAAKRRG